MSTHSGFNVHDSEPVLPDDRDRLEHLARHVCRAPIRLDAMDFVDEQRVHVKTPVHPQTGATRVDLDVFEMIRRSCTQIPDARQHMVTYYGWYSHRVRGERRNREGVVFVPTAEPEPHVALARSRSWARLLRRIYEVDPLLCSQCEVEMQIVGVIQTPTVVDRRDVDLGHVSRSVDDEGGRVGWRCVRGTRGLLRWLDGGGGVGGWAGLNSLSV